MQPEPVALEDASRLARDLFGVDATVVELPGEYDANFLLTPKSGGPRTLLKVMHSSRDPAFIEMQCQALTHIERNSRASNFILQRVERGTGGEPFTSRKIDGRQRIVFALQFIEGRLLAEITPRSAALLESLGECVATIDLALLGFDHPATHRPEFDWDPLAVTPLRARTRAITDPARRALVERALEAFDRRVRPRLDELPRSVIHGDANDLNVVVSVRSAESPRVCGVIDWGDAMYTATVAGLAIACSYAMLDVAGDPLAAMASVIRGYHRVRPLGEHELSALDPLIRVRLVQSAVASAERRKTRPGEPYVTIHEAPVWRLLERLDPVSPTFSECMARDACGLEPYRDAERRRIELARLTPDSPLGGSLDLSTVEVLDLSFGSTFLGSDPAQLTEQNVSRRIAAFLSERGKRIGVGRYDEARPIYTEPLFATGSHPTDERRTIHLGIDLFASVGTPVHAVLHGIVHAVANNASAQDYGPVVVLRHAFADGQPFFTLYGHLSQEALRLRVGQSVASGERIASIGDPTVNGGWPPHLHLQVMLTGLDLGTDFPGVSTPTQRAAFRSLCPDPNRLLRIPQEAFPAPTPRNDDLLAKRRDRLGRNLSLAYSQPLHIVRGFRQYLYDADGRAYLDVFNNVPLVGHSHPHVVRAAQEQLALLNTNTRYLHENAVRYAERLTARMPDPLRVCYFVNSASEANELALRLARTHTKRHDVIVLEHAYHGNTSTLIDISPYKFDGPGGRGKPEAVHVVPIPDDYRGLHRRGENDLGPRYAEYVATAARTAARNPSGLAAFIAETLPSVGGQIVLPAGYLAAAYEHVREHGGVCIADEVQVGFGRLGCAFFGFETQGVVPDIVVLGKPIGNAFPLAAVVTTRAIADSFANGMEYFSTFGGNPVACAVGNAVLDVLERERLQDNARVVGGELLSRLSELAKRHPLVGDVRGFGLFLGVELVRDRSSLEPATREASYLVDRLKESGILAGTDGPHHNVIKIRPPLVLTHSDANFFGETLERVLSESPLSSRR